jgi:peptidylprolyl isomerase
MVVHLAQARHGDTVRVRYTGKLSDGRQFDSSAGRDPLQFNLGEGKIIPGFERAVVGMEPGDSTTVTVKAQDAYGQRRDDLVIVVDRGDFPSDLNPKIGDRLEMHRGEQKIPVNVMAITEESVTLDANHPLAGEDLTFDIELVEIV